MDEHFADLFASYEALTSEPVLKPAAVAVGGSALPHLPEPLPEVALARAARQNADRFHL
jgi:hypothetical protein